MLHGSVTQPRAGLARLPVGQGRALWGEASLRGFLWVSFLSWCLCGHLPVFCFIWGVSFSVFCSELEHAEHRGTVFFLLVCICFSGSIWFL